MSSLLDSAIKRLYQYVDAKVEDVRSFRAIVTGTSSGMVTIRRIHSTSGETALRARCVGFDVAATDEVLCVPMADGIPVIVAKLQRATPTGSFTLPVGLKVSGTSGPGIYAGAGSPEGSVTGEVGSLYQRSNGGADTAVYRKESGSGNTGWVAIANASANEWQRDMVTKSLIADTQSTTPLQVGLTGYTGTADVFDDQLDNNAAGAWLLHNTAASTNAEGGWDLSDVFRTNWYPGWLTYRVQTGGTITNLRIWVGAFSATPMASDDPTIHGVGFRYSTTSGSVNWQAWSNDGSGGGTLTNTGVTPNSHTAYTLEIEIVSTSSVRFYINGTLVATHTTNLPGATTSLYPRCMSRTLNAATKSIRWAWFHAQHT